MYKEELNLKLVHLYPDEMNIYGDMGNLLTLKRRCEWRGIRLDISKVTLDNSKFVEGDIYFMGGGQDNDMYKVYKDLKNNKNEFLKKELKNNKHFLLICGGFQLFGNHFIDFQGRKIDGLGILAMETKAPSDNLHDRCLGNIVSEINSNHYRDIQKYYPGTPSRFLVGFENHGGQTYFNYNSMNPLGNVLVGNGNNSKEKIEGVLFNNIIGSYMHGSLLPKNPHLADYIIGDALAQKYGEEINLEKLDDSIEWNAHNAILKKLRVSNNS